MKVKKFTRYITEKIDINDISKKIDDKYKELKVDLINMIEDSLMGSTDVVNLIDIGNFIEDYISTGKDADMIDGLIEDNDIFNFYLKHQSDIDELLNDSDYLSTSPNENNVYGLYDVVIDGTKESILLSLDSIKEKLF